MVLVCLEIGSVGGRHCVPDIPVEDVVVVQCRCGDSYICVGEGVVVQ